MFAALLIFASQAGWEVTSKADPMTDAVETRATLHGDTADLVFACVHGGRPTLTYVPDEFLGGGHRPYGEQYELRAFTYRFDTSPPKTDLWKYHDRNAVAYEEKRAAGFVSSMATATRLAVRATRYDGRTIDSAFNLVGAGPALHQVFEACGIR